MDVPHHAESHGRLGAPAERVFAHLDDHRRLSAHMARRSWRMGWGKMDVALDAQQGRAVGSHIRLAGRIFGVPLALEETVTEHAPPKRKVWATVGMPRLLVIGPYRMGFELAGPESGADRAGASETALVVFIDYALPERGVSRLAGRLFGHRYARWCTRRMVADAEAAFPAPPPREAARGASSARPGAEAVLKAALFHAEVLAWLLAVGLASARVPRWAIASALLAAALDAAGRAWSRRSPEPMPYFMRWVLYLPRGPHTPARLLRVLVPRSGERILEIGPGVGVHALAVAAALQRGGVLDVLDIQQEMVDALARRAAQRGLTNVAARQGDAQRLPYPDAHFDAAFLMSVLGEIPDPKAALRELRRVLRPGGRLVVGEFFADPDFISLPALRALAEDAGFRFERSAGPRSAYTALFRAPARTS